MLVGVLNRFVSLSEALAKAEEEDIDLVVGDKEMQSGQVAVRTRKGEDLGSMPVQAFVERLRGEVQAKGSAA